MVAAAFAAVAALPASAAPPAIDETQVALAKIHQFNNVAISPDGKRVAYHESYDTLGPDGKPQKRSALFIRDADASTPSVRVSACASADAVCTETGFVWAPDGVHYAFLSTEPKGEQTQIYIGGDGAAPHKVTDIKGDLHDVRWSPNGKSLAFLFIPDAQKPAGALSAYARDLGVVGEKIDEQRIALLTIDAGTLRLVSPGDRFIYEYDWSPDGTKFAATAAKGDGDANWWVADLESIDARTGTARSIHQPALQIASPRFSADGKSIAYIGGIMSDFGSTGGDLLVVPATGGPALNLTPRIKSSVTSFTWNHRSDRITFTELIGGNMAIADLDVASKSVTTRWTAAENIGANADAAVSFSRDGSVSALTRQSFDLPPEVYAGPTGTWRALTNSNLTVRPAWGVAKNVEWKSDALGVQGWLLYPKDYNAAQRYPMITLVHGGPSAATRASFPAGVSGLLASQGYFVFLPNPRGSYGQGEAFTRGNVRDFGGGDLRDILAGVKAAEKIVPIDDARVGIYGWSYGGYMTMFAITQTQRFKAAVAGAGIANWQSYYGQNRIDTWMLPFFGSSVYIDPPVYAKSSPITFIKNVKTPTLVLHGERDSEVPAPQGYEFWRALKAFDVPTQLVIYPDEGHGFQKIEDQRDRDKRIVGWFDRYLK